MKKYLRKIMYPDLDQFKKRHALINAPSRSRQYEKTLQTRTGSQGND